MAAGIIKGAVQGALHRVGYQLSRWPGERDPSVGTYRNKHAGQRCVILGNGPSLNETDLSLLAGETCFGLNKIYLLFDKNDFRPTYVVNCIPDVLRQCADAYADLPYPLFVSREGSEHIVGRKHPTHVLGEFRQFLFSLEPDKEICVGHTVTYVAMQLAYYMGFAKVILIGVDHDFGHEGPTDTWTKVDGPKPQRHFDPNYFPTGENWQTPNLDIAGAHYAFAGAVFRKDGREVVNCTVGGKLECFRRNDLASELATP